MAEDGVLVGGMLSFPKFTGSAEEWIILLLQKNIEEINRGYKNIGGGSGILLFISSSFSTSYTRFFTIGAHFSNWEATQEVLK